ncbi:MAG: phosphate ABC transporter substrate-binding protein [candidate division Zixibacteria bacterium]|nr:phosphate ABC transporter substrate-binding protein [candidate division Zixibacteria bacterium]
MKRTLAFVSIFFIAALFGCAKSKQTVTVKGSDTLVRLGQRWAEEYMKKNRDAVIQVAGGGTGTGFAALLNGTTDICQASRDIKSQETAQATAKNINPYRVAVALDGIAVFVHESNPISTFSLPQLKSIYTGQITNWKALGGPDATIIVYGRENNSGTYSFFKEHVLDEEDFAEQTQTLPGTSAVVNAVAHDVNGIGYGGIAWATGVKHAMVRYSDSSEAISPNPETISAGVYPISRELYWFFDGTPTGLIKDFANFALSPEGQKIALETEYVPLKEDDALNNVIQ